ncbi:MAG: amidohydrolase [Pseudolabrys sp.]|uniref:amidohydrolase family protein n=1 Tax=Pseudorhodoplanes sp. TaxID=1934341 RepID=UPI002A605795|nr:amidohydrolase family protein [Pseudorhodoplanes sp.]MCW5687177.1 amidohydrolase [Pseudolabrys sp.]HWV43540.1 amidohydrolase family protein [Pseudorhodoplanes sp.]
MLKVTSSRDVANEGFNSSVHLKNAAAQGESRNYDDFMIVDVDAHHYETEAFSEIADYIDDPVLRREAKFQGMARGGIASMDGSYQEMTGRITRYPERRGEKVPPQPHRDITLMYRWMDALRVDVACMFPTPMLNIVTCPRIEVEVALARAYNRWLCDNILESENGRLKSMLYLPFNDPAACIDIVEKFGSRKGVIGFMVVATHYRSVHDNAYMKLYSMLQERNLPLAFHAAYTWSDKQLSLTNRFMAVHALGFTWHNMLHMTNWLVNGMPERFPKLKIIWIESGLAWVPFLMQRLDNEFMMRSSDAPLLKRIPSDYMREMYYTSQPMEMVNNPKALEVTFEMINAKTQLLYSSDYPHWDMDLPSTIYDLPFLDEQAKRDILGGNAQRLFNLETTLAPGKHERRAQRGVKAAAG